MAIVKMKRLRLMLVRSRKEELLRELTKLGCVELSEMETESGEDGAEVSLRREGSALLSLRSRLVSVDRALELLNQYAPAKGGLLTA